VVGRGGGGWEEVVRGGGWLSDNLGGRREGVRLGGGIVGLCRGMQGGERGSGDERGMAGRRRGRRFRWRGGEGGVR